MKQKMDLKLSNYSKIIKAIEDFPLPEQVIVKLALNYGLRFTEVMDLEVKDYDSTSRYLLIRARIRSRISRKYGFHSHEFKMNDEIHNMLSLIIGVVPTLGRIFPRSKNGYLLYIKRLFKKAGIEEFSFRDLRRFAAINVFKLQEFPYVDKIQ